MERGELPLSTVGAFDLQSTLESGQSYLWWREDGRDYDDSRHHGGDAWYVTTSRASDEPAVIRLRQIDGVLEWESTVDAESIIRQRLRLEDDLAAIRESAPSDAVIQAAYDEYWGMRLVREPTFPTLISFICSTQMRIARIHGMQQSLRETYGAPVEFDGKIYHAYPTPEELASATEEDLRALSLGYRAPYVRDTAQLVAEGSDPDDIAGKPYEAARKSLTKYVGVGDKVADCVLLFSLGYLEAVPLDTWIRKSIASYYPECDRDDYTETSRAIREALGGEFAGYTQTYLFHYLRRNSEVAPPSQ